MLKSTSQKIDLDELELQEGESGVMAKVKSFILLEVLIDMNVQKD